MNFLKQESKPEIDKRPTVDAVHVVLTRPIPKSSATKSQATTSIASTVQTVIAGLVFGVAVTVLYQNLSGHKAGEPIAVASAEESADAQAIARIEPENAAQQSPQVKQTTAPPKSTPTAKVPSPTPSRRPAPPVAQTVALQPATVPIIDVPLPQTLRAPSIKTVSLPAVHSATAVQDASENDDAESGVHVEFRKGPRQVSKPAAKLAAQVAAESDTKPSSAPDKTKEPPPEGGLPKPEQSVLNPAPKFTVLRQQGDGVMIRMGNQVRFVPAGSLLPDGTKAGENAR